MQTSSDREGILGPEESRPDGGLREPPPLAAWLPWLQLGLSSMLLVLFLVMLARTRELSASQRQLEQRVAGLENSRRLDRTTALEQQIQAMLQRLQALETVGTRLDRLNAQQEQLQQLLLQLRSRPILPDPLEPDGLQPPPSSRPASPRASGSRGAGSLRGNPPVLRPPAMESY